MPEEDTMESFKVLLVDDEEDFTEVLAERLEARGMVVDTASNCEAALAKSNEIQKVKQERIRQSKKKWRSSKKE